MPQGSLVSVERRNRVRGVAVPVATALGRLGFTPNALTVLGFFGTCAAAAAAAAQAWALAGALLLFFGIFDMFDGALARATGRTTRFGSFLDSTLDRTGENLVLGGIAVGFAAAGFPLGVAAAVLAVAFASVVTYARAKAESLGVQGEVGVAPRPERLLLIAGGLVLAGVLGGVGPIGPAGTYLPGTPPLLAATALVAALSAITVLQRIVHVRKQLDQGDSR